MISSDAWIEPVARVPSVIVGEHPHILARALAHLLGRDEERPARWLSDAFAHAVQSYRADLRDITSPAGLNAIGQGSGTGSPFRAAVTLLGQDPAHVAVAIRDLEISRGLALPVWGDLMRRGLPARFADTDASLWFG